MRAGATYAGAFRSKAELNDQASAMLTAIIAMAGLLACSAPNAAADLGWLAGTWRTDTDSGYSEVTFGPQYKERMAGVLRVVSDGKTILLELISIELGTKNKVLLVRHFSADLHPTQSAPMNFSLVEACNGRAAFANSAGADPSPQRSRYWIDDAGQLRVVIEGIKGQDGSTRKYESRLTKVR